MDIIYNIMRIEKLLWVIPSIYDNEALFIIKDHISLPNFIR